MKTFKPIQVRGVRVEASGGLIELSHQPYRADRHYFIGMPPALAREVAAAMLQAADACEGKFDGVDPKHIETAA